MHKDTTGEIKASRIKREPHSAQRSAAPAQFGATLLDLGRLYAWPRALLELPGQSVNGTPLCKLGPFPGGASKSFEGRLGL